jgi:hypothetical protein
MKNTQWIVHFEGGGWNLVDAVFKQQAYDIAVKKFNGENIKVQSVEIATDEKIQNLMSLFW